MAIGGFGSVVLILNFLLILAGIGLTIYLAVLFAIFLKTGTKAFQKYIESKDNNNGI